MTRFFVTIDGNERSVTKATSGSLTIDGVVYETEVERLSAHRFSVLVNGRSATVLMGDDADRPVVHVNGKQIEVGVQTEREKLMRELGDAGEGKGGPVELRAPMPALVGAVFVAPGDLVKKGQGLLILEAMKMENEIKANADGVVKEISVAKGAAVDKNDVLIRFEQPTEQGEG